MHRARIVADESARDRERRDQLTDAGLVSRDDRAGAAQRSDALALGALRGRADQHGLGTIALREQIDEAPVMLRRPFLGWSVGCCRRDRDQRRIGVAPARAQPRAHLVEARLMWRDREVVWIAGHRER